MIERYTRPELRAIWSEESKFQAWLDVELYACEAQAELGRIPKDAVTDIRKKAKFSVQRINEIEETTNHDVIAFLTNVAEHVGENSRFVHLGLTSSDVVDTALTTLIVKAGREIMRLLVDFKDALSKRAVEHKYTPAIGRTHGVHAEPTTFGLKLALWYAEIERDIERLERAIDTIAYGKISGAVGTYAHAEPFVEQYVCEKLGLKPAPISTQVLQRDRHAEFVSTLAIIGGTLEKIAVEIRHLQRTEVREAEEFFAKGQKGSSAMPHKRNPITCERISGMARLLRGYALSAMENQALWHERDISHSSVERVILPDATIGLHYMLYKAIPLIEKLLVYPEELEKNLHLTRGLIFSQQVLLALAESGMLREDAYRIVQTHAMDVWQGEGTLQEKISADDEVRAVLSEEEIVNCFTLDKYTKNVDLIFDRLGLQS